MLKKRYFREGDGTIDHDCHTYIYYNVISLRKVEASRSKVAVHFNKKPPRGSVEALNTGTLRENETELCP
jgi:hypothetical protein